MHVKQFHVLHINTSNTLTCVLWTFGLQYVFEYLIPLKFSVFHYILFWGLKVAEGFSNNVQVHVHFIERCVKTGL